MDIEDIKNKALKELVISVEKNDASSTIDADLEDALNESSNDEELIQNWQGKLESLYKETQHYWDRLEIENMKSRKQYTGITCVKNPKIKCYNKATTPAPECADVPVCEMGLDCNGR